MVRRKNEKPETTQLELLPTAKSEQALNSYTLVKEHSVIQKRLQEGLYRCIAEKIRDGNLSVTELKQLQEMIRGAGSWMKQTQDALILAESSAIEALEANSGITLDLSGLDDSELEKTLEEYEKKIRGL